MAPSQLLYEQRWALGTPGTPPLSRGALIRTFRSDVSDRQVAMRPLTFHNRGDAPMTDAELTTFATGYAAAWSSQDPARFAAHYAERGTLVVNGGAPSVGRAAITATAHAYMTAFPDMRVTLDFVRQEDGYPVFHWTWTGTNTGPGGTGKAVRLHGYERWTIDADGLLLESQGHFNDAEYQRQLQQGAPPP